MCKLHFCPMHNSPQRARASPFSKLRDYTQTHHTRQDTSGRVITPTQKTIPDNTQQSQETDIHATDRNRTRNHRSKRAAADPRHRPRRHWNRPQYATTLTKLRKFQGFVMGFKRKSSYHQIADVRGNMLEKRVTNVGEWKTTYTRSLERVAALCG